jgi:DNA-binding winged helix-turn-helix (wHTH) protein/hemoglobin-like flavoprotein
LRWAFSDCELDDGALTLRRAGKQVAAQPLVLELLLYLLRHRERVVTREELAAEVWRARVVGDAALARAVRKAREAIGDDGDAQRLIQTVHGRGFRFVGELRGAAEPETVAPAPPVAAQPAASAVADVLVGRADALERFERLLARALSESRGATLLVSGEAGIGKTRLLDELALRAHARGALCLRGSNHPIEGVPPCWALAQVVRAALARLPEDRADALRAALAPLLPGAAASFALDTQAERFRLFENVAALIAEVARERALVLCLDDFHCADSASQSLAVWLSRELRGSPVVLVCAYREPIANVAASLLHGDAELCELRGLSAGEVAELVTRRTGSMPSAAVVRELHGRTAGNPLYVHHLWPQLAAKRPQAKLPDTLRNAILSHVSAAAGTALRVLSAAAAAGETFTPARAAAALDLPLPQVLEALQSALQAGLVRSAREPIGHLELAHGLMREALYEQLEPDARAEIHGRLGALLLATYREREAAHAEELAQHLLRAPLAVQTSDGIRVGLLAAEQAFRKGAFDQCAALCRAVLQSMALLPEAHAEREAATLRLASALGRDGRFNEAVEAFRTLRNAPGGTALLASVDLRALHESLERVADRMPEMVHAMYGTLFARHPEARTLFRRNRPDVQERMLADALTSIVDQFQDAPWLEETLLALGARHAAYGVRDEMYAWVGEALLEALAHTLGDDWTPRLSRAWTDAYAAISVLMLAGQAAALTPQRGLAAHRPASAT